MRAKQLIVLAWVAVGGIAGVAWAGEDAKAGAKPNVAAYIGDSPITTDELDAKILKTNMKLAQDLYNARKAAVDEVILDRALGADAKAKNVTVDQLLKEKVAAKVAPVTDAEVSAYVETNKARMGGKTLEQVSGQVKSYLTQQKETEARDGILKEIKSSANVRITLDAPRAEIKLAANDPIKGPKDAKVTVVEYSDFQCPFCSRGAATMTQVAEAYKDKVRIVFRDNPLPMHNRAPAAAEAAQCANEQGKFWEFHDKLFAAQTAMTDDDFKKYATELGLNVETFTSCFTSGKYKADVQNDMKEGAAAGVQGTPAFFVNGRFVNGAQPFEAFKAMIDEELSK